MGLLVNLELAFEPRPFCIAYCYAPCERIPVSGLETLMGKGEPAIGLEPMTC
jgi:hypothetical protein